MFTFPQLDGLVVFQCSRGDNVLVRMASSAYDAVGVATQLLHYLFGLQIPNVNHVVLGAGHDPLGKIKGSESFPI